MYIRDLSRPAVGEHSSHSPSSEYHHSFNQSTVDRITQVFQSLTVANNTSICILFMEVLKSTSINSQQLNCPVTGQTHFIILTLIVMLSKVIPTNWHSETQPVSTGVPYTLGKANYYQTSGSLPCQGVGKGVHHSPHLRILSFYVRLRI